MSLPSEKELKEIMSSMEKDIRIIMAEEEVIKSRLRECLKVRGKVNKVLAELRDRKKNSHTLSFG